MQIFQDLGEINEYKSCEISYKETLRRFSESIVKHFTLSFSIAELHKIMNLYDVKSLAPTSLHVCKIF